jgi:hypothetical protein
MKTSKWTAALAALGLMGCMSSADFAGRAVEHNKAIAMAADQVLLLNIVRARNDRPIVYSQFRGVSENFNARAGLSVNVPFGADAGNYYNSDIDFGPSQNVSLETAPLDDVDYYQGVMRPVMIGLLRYYLDNGWPPDLVAALTFEKISIGEGFYRRVVRESDAACAGIATGACGRINDPSRRRALPALDRGQLVFYNDPRSPDLYDPFHNLVLRLIVLGLTIDGTYASHELRIPASSNFLADTTQVQTLMAMYANVRREGDSYVVTASSWIPGLRLTRLSDSNVRVEGDLAGSGAIDMTASLRSPDSILFYIGAYARDGGADATVLVGGPGQERFLPVFELSGCDDAVVEVEFDGACYGIPREGSPLSMKVVAFLHQIFGLNKRAVEPPNSATVRVVN